MADDIEVVGMWYRFINVKKIKSEKEAMALLYELGRRGIAGAISFHDGYLEIGFLREPTHDELSFLKQFLQADRFEEVDLYE